MAERSLCLDCGLCCDGTLFAQVPVTPDEAARLQGRVRLSPDGSKLLQGCGALQGCACGVYADRPTTCRQYKCVVLRSLEAGLVSEAEATHAIQEVLALRQQVADLAGGGDAREGLRAGRAQAAAGTASPELLEALGSLGRAIAVMQLPLLKR